MKPSRRAYREVLALLESRRISFCGIRRPVRPDAQISPWCHKIMAPPVPAARGETRELIPRRSPSGVRALFFEARETKPACNRERGCGSISRPFRRRRSDSSRAAARCHTLKGDSLLAALHKLSERAQEWGTRCPRKPGRAWGSRLPTLFLVAADNFGDHALGISSNEEPPSAES